MHVISIAEQFAIDTILIPAASGVASAVGLLATDLTVERSQTHLVPTADAAPEALEARLSELAALAGAELGVELEQPDVSVARFVDVRFLGQAHELTVRAPDRIATAADLAGISDVFFAEYLRAYGIRLGAATELVNLRVRVTQHVPKLEFPVAKGGGGPTATGRRSAYFAEAGGYIDVDVHSRERATVGDRFVGPALVEEPETTLVIPPGWSGDVDASGVIVVRRH